MDIFQVAQRVDDLPRARALYQRLLGAPPTGVFDSPGMVFFQAGPIRLLLEYGATSALIPIKVDDVHATIESLRADNVKIVTEPYVIFHHLTTVWDRPAPTSGCRPRLRGQPARFAESQEV